MKKTFILAALALFVFTISCQGQRAFVAGDSEVMEADHTKTDHFFVFGIFQTSETDAASMCGDKGVKAVEAKMTFIDAILSGVTYNLYSPRTMKVYCNE